MQMLMKKTVAMANIEKQAAAVEELCGMADSLTQGNTMEAHQDAL